MDTTQIQATCLKYLQSTEGSQDSPFFFQYYALFPQAPQKDIIKHADIIFDYLAQSPFDRLSDAGEISWLHYVMVVAPHLQSRVSGLLKDIEHRVIEKRLTHRAPAQREIVLYVLTHLVFVCTWWGTRVPELQFEQTTLNVLNKAINNPVFGQMNDGFRYTEPRVLRMELILASIYLGTSYHTRAQAEEALRAAQASRKITTHARLVMFELFHALPTPLSASRGDPGVMGMLTEIDSAGHDQTSRKREETNKVRSFLYHHTRSQIPQNKT